MSKKIRVGVIFGGKSAEHQVSLVSAGSVMNALDKNKYDIVPIGISPAGEWIAGVEAIGLLKENKKNDHLKVYLPADPTIKALLSGNNIVSAAQNSEMHEQLDVIFPVLHGTFGEDGTIQGLFELANIPFVGAGVLGSSVCMDKILQKQVCRQSGIPVSDYIWFRSVDWFGNDHLSEVKPLENQILNMERKDILQSIGDTMGFPVFVKPPNQGSSIGISKAHNIAELKEAIEYALHYDRKVLIEQAVPHAREIEISVLGNEFPRASVAGEIIPSNEFYDYDAKYVDEASGLVIPAQISDNLLKEIQNNAIRGVMAVEAEGMARVDFLLEKGTERFYLNEINTIPGFTSISMYPKLWAASGLDYSSLLDELIRLAIDRHEKRAGIQTSFKPKKEWYK